MWQGEGAEGYILDLRSNPGGLVTAGLEVARLWLDGENVPVFNVRLLSRCEGSFALCNSPSSVTRQG